MALTRSVLVVDDSQVDREKLRSVLEKNSCQVRLAENGQLALDAVQSSRPEVIFMDVNMPVMDGFAAMRALRDNAETKDIPVVLVTAKDQKADKAWGKMLGAKAYITKPFTDDDVTSVLAML